MASAGDVPIVMREATGEVWNEHAFRKAFALARAAAHVEGKRYQDLRDTAVTWLARAGCTIPEICAITGHSLQSATQILKHYLEFGEPLAREAIKICLQSNSLQSWVAVIEFPLVSHSASRWGNIQALPTISTTLK